MASYNLKKHFLSDMTPEEIDAEFEKFKAQQKGMRNTQHITMKEFDEIMLRLDRIERRIEELFYALGKSDPYDI